LEVAHGNISLEDRRIFPCTVPGCDRSFTKKGNLTVHIRTVHEGEKRFVCGETDVSASKRVTGWSGDGCGKRYGSKLALEEHIRTAHLGFQNSKAERRQRLGLTKKRQESSNLSALASLTGEGYDEETGRQITCFVNGCPHRFHRNYDLWVHMGSKHNYTEDDIRDLFLQRALLGDDPEPVPGDVFGIYGLEFDTGTPSCDPMPAETHADPTMLLPEISTDLPTYPSQATPGYFDPDLMMQEATPTFASSSVADFKIPNPDDMTMIDPFLDYSMSMVNS
jgi:hypothetical protein